MRRKAFIWLFLLLKYLFWDKFSLYSQEWPKIRYPSFPALSVGISVIYQHVLAYWLLQKITLKKSASLGVRFIIYT